MAQFNTIASFKNERAEDYKRFRKNLDAMRDDPSHEDHELYRAASAEVAAIVKAAEPASAVHQNEVLTQIAVKYHNEQMVGLDLMPYVSTDGKLSAVYFSFDQPEHFGIPDDSIAEGGDPNEVSESHTSNTVTLSPRANSELVPQVNVVNASDPLRPLVEAVEHLAELSALAQESRILTQVMTAGNYGANTAAIAAADRWNTATGGDPAGDVDTAKAACFPGGGAGSMIGVMSPAVWNVLKRHPRFVDTFKYVTGTPSALAQACAEWLELDGIVVPKAWYDTANEGGTATYARLCSNSFAILRVASSPQPRTAAFGYTFQDGPKASEQIWNAVKGSRGGTLCKVGYNDSQTVVGPLTSYLLTTPIG